MSFKFDIDLKNFRRDIEAESKKKAQEQIKSLSNNELMTIGEAAIDEVKTVIEKGLSPIKGAGRFPAYKWAGKKSAKKNKDKYPYSAMSEFPDKKERPVNLKLSGSFLKNLNAKVSRGKVFIGFFEEPWTLYERGHREGANGQPKRPIIPQEDEELSDSILRRLAKVVQSVFDKKK